MLAVQLEPHDVGDESDVRESLAALLAELPEPYALVLSLVELEGATLADVAEFMALSPASLRLLYMEGRRRLRDVVLARTETGTI